MEPHYSAGPKVHDVFLNGSIHRSRKSQLQYYITVRSGLFIEQTDYKVWSPARNVTINQGDVDSSPHVVLYAAH